MDNETQREIKVPISSQDIEDMIDMMLEDKMQRLSINEVPIYKINWGNKSFIYPLKNMFTYNQRRRYENLRQMKNVNKIIKGTQRDSPTNNQSHCDCDMCTSTEIKIRQTKMEDKPLEIKISYPTPEVKFQVMAGT